MPKTVVGLFDHAADAQAALDELADLGFNRADIDLVPTAPRHPGHGPATSPVPPPSSGASTGAGAAIGAFIGGVLGLLAALGVLKILAISTFFAAGPIIGVVVGGVFGAAVGGLAGGLRAMGAVEEIQETNEGYLLRRDGALLSVITDDQHAERAAEILSAHNALDVDRRASDWQGIGWQHLNWPRPTDVEPRTRAVEPVEPLAEESSPEPDGVPRRSEPRRPRPAAADDSLPTLTPNESIYEDRTRSSAARLYRP